MVILTHLKFSQKNEGRSTLKRFVAADKNAKLFLGFLSARCGGKCDDAQLFRVKFCFTSRAGLNTIWKSKVDDEVGESESSLKFTQNVRKSYQEQQIEKE